MLHQSLKGQVNLYCLIEFSFKHVRQISTFITSTQKCLPYKIPLKDVTHSKDTSQTLSHDIIRSYSSVCWKAHFIKHHQQRMNVLCFKTIECKRKSKPRFLFGYTYTPGNRSLSTSCKHSKSQSKGLDISTAKPPVMKFVELENQGRKCEIAYMDEGDRSGVVALALHGVPGGFHDFESLVEPLVKLGVRVLALDFPGSAPHSVVPDLHTYDFSTEARAELTLAFMKALNINKVDLLIGHSAGSVPVYKLCADTNLFRSCVLLNPVCHTPHRTLRPHWLVCLVGSGLRYHFFSPIISAVLPTIYSMIGFTIKDVTQLKSSTLTAIALDFNKHVEYGKMIAEKQVHTLLVSTKTDSVVEWPIPHGMIQLLEIDEHNQLYYDKEGCTADNTHASSEVSSERFAKALIFERGGHFGHRKYPDIVIQHLTDLLERMKTPY